MAAAETRLGDYFVCVCDRLKKKRTPLNCDRTHQLSDHAKLKSRKKIFTMFFALHANSSDHTATFDDDVHIVSCLFIFYAESRHFFLVSLLCFCR